MKKLTALILTLSMLLSMVVLPMGASAAEITEAERKAILAEKDYEYIDISKNIDAFASATVIRDYATFNKAVNSADPFNQEYTGDYTYRNQIPSVTKDGLTAITGEESYYKKGISNTAIDAVRTSPLLYATESFKMSVEELKALELMKYSKSDASTTAKNVASDPVKYVPYVNHFESPEYNYLPNIVKTEEAGENYYVYLKANEADAQFKIGPINDKEYVKNSFDYIKPTDKTLATFSGTKGGKFAVAITTAEVNNGGGYTGDYKPNLPAAQAALVPFEFSYNVNGKTVKEKQYVVVTSANQTVTARDDLVGLSIFSADKYDAEGNEIDYTNTDLYYLTKTATSPLTRLENSGLTLEDIQFPSNIKAAEMNVAISLRARQDTVNNDYGNKASVGIFDLKDEELTKVTVVNEQTPGDNTDIEGVIGIHNGSSSSSSAYPRALIPVSFKDPANADENKVYFMYVARVSACPAILGATIINESLQDKIDALNEVLSALDSAALTEEDIASYKAQIAAVKALSEYILDSDFDTSKLAEAEKRIEEEKAAEEAARQEAIRQEILNKMNTETVDMHLFEDVFATDNDYTTTGWSKADAANILNMKGFALSSSGQVYPSKDQAAAFRVSQIGTVANITEADGKYTYTLNGIPFALGTISTADAVKGANAWIPRAKYNYADYTGSVAVEEVPENYVADTSGQVNKGTFAIGKSGVTEANILATNVWPNQTEPNKFLDVKVTYEGGESEDIYMVIGMGFESVEDSVYLVPKAEYDAIKADSALTDTLPRSNKLTVAEYKALVAEYVDEATAAGITSVPSNWGSEPAKTVLAGLKAKTKYTNMVNASVKLGSLNAADIDLDAFAAAKANTNARRVVLPSATGEFLPARRYTSYTANYAKTYVANHKIPLDASKVVESIEISSNLTDAEIPVGESGGFSERGTYNVLYGALLLTYNGNETVTINGTEYVAFMKLQRDCAESIVFGMTLVSPSLNDKIAELNAELDAVDYESITKEGCVALREKIEALKAENENIKDSDFHTEALAAAEARIKAEMAEVFKSLKNKTDFAISEANGANAKFFIDYTTYQGYKSAQNFPKEFVKGVDYSGIVSVATGTDSDVIHNNINSAFVYKIDQTDATSQYAGYVNFTTKNGKTTWTVNDIEFVVNPYEKAVKVYTGANFEGVEDADLKARFASVDNPVLDVADSCYESITLLAGSPSGTYPRSLTPTIVYEDGTTQKLSPVSTGINTYTKDVDTQHTGWTYLQSLINWANTNSNGGVIFKTLTITGFDTTKKIDKISFKSDGNSNAIFVIGAFGETATIEEILTSADATDATKAKAALDTVDAILAENNITADDLTVALTAKYNELKAATATLTISEVVVENNVVTVNYVNEKVDAVKAVLIVAQYNADETQLVAVKSYPVTFATDATTFTQNVETDAANKVKVLIWKDLIDFSPLYR